jgi:hypothetical protein
MNCFENLLSMQLKGEPLKIERWLPADAAIFSNYNPMNISENLFANK